MNPMKKTIQAATGLALLGATVIGVNPGVVSNEKVAAAISTPAADAGGCVKDGQVLGWYGYYQKIIVTGPIKSGVTPSIGVRRKDVRTGRWTTGVYYVRGYYPCSGTLGDLWRW